MKAIFVATTGTLMGYIAFHLHSKRMRRWQLMGHHHATDLAAQHLLNVSEHKRESMRNVCRPRHGEAS
jgi:hypothetical protein